MGNTIWDPKYLITPTAARALMEIERARTVVANTPLTPASEAELKRQARIRSTHYSTYIEGNRLTLKETEAVITKKVKFYGRERDAREVQNYWEALLRVEKLSGQHTEFSEQLIKQLHAIVEKGKGGKPDDYRTGQNVIKDSQTGGIVYLPPEAKDVGALMMGLIRWVKKSEKEKIPVPIIAGLVHYQFVTIHPYYGGNGRTARLLATFILQRDGYGLNGFFSMEEHHAKELEKYYNSLATHQHHNYYEGREYADLTKWIEYFVLLMAGVFKQAQEETRRYVKQPINVQPKELAELDHREKTVLALFADSGFITCANIALTLGITHRMARYLVKTWIKKGWLIMADVANKSRKYKLAEKYRQFIGN